MSASNYYNNDESNQGAQSHNYHGGYQQDQSYQHSANAGSLNQSQDRANPYGYPESNTPQPYYGQSGPPQGQSYGQQQQSSYGYQNQQHGQYEAQSSYGYQQQQHAPPAYDNNYAPQGQHTAYNQPPPHDQYAHNNDTQRQQGYESYGQSQLPLDPATSGARFDPNAPPAEGDRGLMGALAGGAIGAYGGHKMGHGVIGGIGGAIAGSKLEDHYKDKKKKEKKEKKLHKHGRRGSHSSSSSSSSSDSDSDGDKKHRKHKYAAAGAVGVAGAGAYGASHYARDTGSHGGGGYAGNFSSSAKNITLDRDYDLIALCSDRHGEGKLSSIDLNDCLTNEWGELRWARNGNAFASAKNVRLIDGGRGLEAELGDGRGGWRISRIALDERIGNENGELVFLG